MWYSRVAVIRDSVVWISGISSCGIKNLSWLLKAIKTNACTSYFQQYCVATSRLYLKTAYLTLEGVFTKVDKSLNNHITHEYESLALNCESTYYCTKNSSLEDGSLLRTYSHYAYCAV